MLQVKNPDLLAKEYRKLVDYLTRWHTIRMKLRVDAVE